MKHFDIAVYYRLDATLAAVIASTMYTARIVEGHRFQVACDATDAAIAFAKINPGCMVCDLTYNELTGQGIDMYKGKTRYVIIGVSLKKAKLEDFQKLTRSPYFYIHNISEGHRNDEKNKTANPNIFCINSNYYWHGTEEIVMGDLNAEEAEWIELWNGFDHYYSYSDDHSVYRRWKHKETEIYAKGVTLGLNNDRMKKLYRQYFCK